MKLKILALFAAVVTINCFGGRYYEYEDNDISGLPWRNSQTIDQLKQITLQDVTKITKLVGSQCITYTATLLDGDMLVGDYFYQGSLQGEISCSRTVYINPFMPLIISVRSSLFHELERLYEEQNDQHKA